MFIPDTVSVYELIDPNTQKIRYVGQTGNPATRFVAYTSRKSIMGLRNVKLREWLLGLNEQSQKPIINILKEVPFKYGRVEESARIKFLKDNGEDLLNLVWVVRLPRKYTPPKPKIIIGIKKPVKNQPVNPSNTVKTYTTKEVSELAGLTRQRINQWRNSKSETGFKLTEDTDWKWDKGNIIYFESAIKKIKENRK